MGYFEGRWTRAFSCLSARNYTMGPHYNQLVYLKHHLDPDVTVMFRCWAAVSPLRPARLPVCLYEHR